MVGLNTRVKSTETEKAVEKQCWQREFGVSFEYSEKERSSKSSRGR